ncbi:hypothetical protein [Deinococcus hopiensis]|uniref:hypothetical protein n=1 Tax=Deinococcus hopiensis TaxID=309885 RepID=UPI0009FD57B3|nr:hypothetical protein [Deinococcus hopiensis]
MRRRWKEPGERGFSTTRIKTGAAPWNAGVLRSGEDAAQEPPGRLFEHHPRVTPEGDLTALQALCRGNPFGRREDGAQEWSVTLRAGGVGRETAEAGAAPDPGGLAAPRQYPRILRLR